MSKPEKALQGEIAELRQKLALLKREKTDVYANEPASYFFGLPVETLQQSKTLEGKE